MRNTWVYFLGGMLFLIFGLLLLQKPAVLGASDSSSYAAGSNSIHLNLKFDFSNVSGQIGKAISESQKVVSRIKNPQKNFNMSAQTAAIVTQPPQINGNITVVAPPKKDTAKLNIPGLGSYDVEVKASDTAFDILVRASAQNNFDLKYEAYDWGVMITKIGVRQSQGTYYWAFYYNGAYSNVGASAQKVTKDDITEWRYESWM